MKICIVFFLGLYSSRSFSSGGFTIDTEAEDARVVLITRDGDQYKQKIQGQVPISLQPSQYKNTVIKLEAPGKIPFYWYFLDQFSDNRSIYLVPTTLGPADSQENYINEKIYNDLNRSNELTMSGYTALNNGQLELASDFIEKAIRLYPEVATYYILKGMLSLKKGNVKQAKDLWLYAKSLDPNDPDLEQLINTL